MYGATEASARLTWLDPRYYFEKTGSIGREIPGVTIKTLDETGGEVRPGEIGELVASGPNIMLGYYLDPVSTSRVLDVHGYHTGDLGLPGRGRVPVCNRAPRQPDEGRRLPG